MVIVEIESDQRQRNDRHDPFDGIFEFLITRAGIAVRGFIQAWVGKYCLAPRVSDRGNCFVARNTDRRLAQCRSKLFAAPQAQEPQQVLVGLDVAVQRWLAHAKLSCDPRQRERVEAFGVCERCRGVNDPLLI